MRPLFLLTLLPLLAVSTAADWPQFLGPSRNGTIPADPELTATVPADGFKILWKRACGSGFAGPVVSGGSVILFHRTDGENAVEAMETGTGRTLWKTTWPTGYRDDFGFDDGPRSCPTVDGGSVFCYGAEGTFAAVQANDGKLLWKRDLASELQSGKGFFGRACAPLVSGRLILLAAGGDEAGIIACDRTTGETQWKIPGIEAGYASPILMHPPQGPRAIFFTREGVTGVEPDTGRVVFSAPFRAKMHASVNAASPVATDATHFLTTASYDTGAALWEIGRDDTLTASWRTHDKLDCHYSTPLLLGGQLYGFHGRQESGQELRCLNAADGSIRWSAAVDPGHLIAAGRQLFILTDKGELILTTAAPEGKPDLTARGDILRGGHRAPPALAGGRLFARDKSQLVCVDLRRNGK